MNQNNLIRDTYLLKHDEYLSKNPYGWQNSVEYMAQQSGFEYVMKKFNLTKDEAIKILKGF